MKELFKSISRRVRKIPLLNIFLSCFIFLLVIGITELLLRSTHIFGARISWAKPDSLIGWRNTPGFTYWNNNENDHPISGKFNSFGWRDSEWSLEKSPNIYRIAVLGDSYIEALQVESDRSFLALSEAWLNSYYKKKVEFLNFGQAGFTQTEEYIVLTNEVIQFSPDMVILFFLPGNDIRDISNETAPNALRPFYKIDKNEKLILDTSFNNMFSFKLKSYITPFKQYSAIISLLAERYNLLKQSRQFGPDKADQNAPHGKLEGALSLATAKPDQIYLSNYRLNKLLIKKMAEFCKENKVVFMLVTTDIQSYITENKIKYHSIDPTFDSNFFEDDLKEYAESLDIKYLGLQRIFTKHYEQTGTRLHWGHWNYSGHKVVAHALSNKLEEILYTSN